MTRRAMTSQESERFVNALREVLGMGPIGGERYRSDVERFATSTYQDPTTDRSWNRTKKL